MGPQRVLHKQDSLIQQGRDALWRFQMIVTSMYYVVHCKQPLVES